MGLPDPKSYWNAIYQTKKPEGVSWYTPHLEKSLELIRGLSLNKDARIIDVGGGASTLPDDLLSEGFKNLAILDISAEALQVSRDRLGDKGKSVKWIEADATKVNSEFNYYDLWHDRAAFHFLTEGMDRRNYVDTLMKSLKKGGYCLIATFGPNGPLKCSGLEIVRYSAENLQKEIGREFSLEKHFTEIHKTPFDTEQEFLYCLFRKNG